MPLVSTPPSEGRAFQTPTDQRDAGQNETYYAVHLAGTGYSNLMASEPWSPVASDKVILDMTKRPRESAVRSKLVGSCLDPKVNDSKT